jgi:hypothetical protein
LRSQQAWIVRDAIDERVMHQMARAGSTAIDRLSLKRFSESRDLISGKYRRDDFEPRCVDGADLLAVAIGALPQDSAGSGFRRCVCLLRTINAFDLTCAP